MSPWLGHLSSRCVSRFLHLASLLLMLRGALSRCPCKHIVVGSIASPSSHPGSPAFSKHSSTQVLCSFCNLREMRRENTHIRTKRLRCANGRSYHSVGGGPRSPRQHISPGASFAAAVLSAARLCGALLPAALLCAALLRRCLLLRTALLSPVHWTVSLLARPTLRLLRPPILGRRPVGGRRALGPRALAWRSLERPWPAPVKGGDLPARPRINAVRSPNAALQVAPSADGENGSTARVRVRAAARQVYPKKLTNLCGGERAVSGICSREQHKRRTTDR